MKQKGFFKRPGSTAQRHYEALRTFYLDKHSSKDVAKRFKMSENYFTKLRSEFTKSLQQNIDPFFVAKKAGRKTRSTKKNIIDRIIALRKQNYSINDIKTNLHSDNTDLSLDTIDKILKAEGFVPLPKRTRDERRAIMLPPKLEAPCAVSLDIQNETFTTEQGAGPLIFLPLLAELGIVKAIQESNFPSTSKLSALQNVLSFLALKLMGGQRWSHDTQWNMDRALGLFAFLNVLPKATTLSTYSYRVSRQSNLTLLQKLSCIFENESNNSGEFNLDFKAIPHWGDASVLEKNWCGSRTKSMKSLLALIVQNPQSGNMSYTNAEIKHTEQNDCVLEFVDFWKSGHGVAPKMLIFDSKFTGYKQLNILNKSEDNIKFLTLRRRGKNLIEDVEKIPEHAWQDIQVERAKGRKQSMRVHDKKCKLRHYEGEVRQIIITDHGRKKPAFLITNDFDLDVRVLVKKYARRWLVEQEIAEQIAFFHLNHPSSSIVVKVDFDLTLSLLAHNLYRYLANELPGFENCTAETIYRKFIENGANIVIENKKIHVQLKKKTHLPVLLDLPLIRKAKSTMLNWMGVEINFTGATVS